MATKKTPAKKVEVAPQVQTEPAKTAKPVKPTWEIKDRIYYLKGNKNPLTLTIPCRHTRKHALLYFDPKDGKQREIRYATNQNSPFKDEQAGEATLGHIIFRDGTMEVKKENQALQKILSLYHPLKDVKFREHDPIEVAEDELGDLELSIDALNAARSMDIDQAEAILRVEMGSRVTSMSSKEIKRDILLFAQRNPSMFLELANDDNVQLRNFAIRATEANILKLADDQRTFNWASNGRKLMTVPFDENPYSAMAAFFKTDEGLEIFKSIEKKFA